MSVAKILVIDDNDTDIFMLRHGLDAQREEYDLEVLKDGEAALRFVNAHRMAMDGPEPCVILLDLHLPHYDGLEVLEAIRIAPALTHIKVIMLSGMASPSERIKITSKGAVYREKPASLAEFIDLGAEIFAVCNEDSAVLA